MIEQQIHKIWSEKLNLEAFSDDDDFFELGGHSLIMAQIQEAIAKEFTVEVPMDELFQHATVNLASNHLRALLPVS